MNYLPTLLNEDLQYRTVNAHQSAISTYHNFINGEPIGKHPKICALLAGIFMEDRHKYGTLSFRMMM